MDMSLSDPLLAHSDFGWHADACILERLAALEELLLRDALSPRVAGVLPRLAKLEATVALQAGRRTAGLASPLKHGAGVRRRLQAIEDELLAEPSCRERLTPEKPSTASRRNPGIEEDVEETRKLAQNGQSSSRISEERRRVPPLKGFHKAIRRSEEAEQAFSPCPSNTVVWKAADAMPMPGARLLGTHCLVADAASGAVEPTRPDPRLGPLQAASTEEECRYRVGKIGTFSYIIFACACFYASSLPSVMQVLHTSLFWCCALEGPDGVLLMALCAGFAKILHIPCFPLYVFSGVFGNRKFGGLNGYVIISAALFVGEWLGSLASYALVRQYLAKRLRETEPYRSFRQKWEEATDYNATKEVCPCETWQRVFVSYLLPMPLAMGRRHWGYIVDWNTVFAVSAISLPDFALGSTARLVAISVWVQSSAAADDVFSAGVSRGGVLLAWSFCFTLLWLLAITSLATTLYLARQCLDTDRRSSVDVVN